MTTATPVDEQEFANLEELLHAVQYLVNFAKAEGHEPSNVAVPPFSGRLVLMSKETEGAKELYVISMGVAEESEW